MQLDKMCNYYFIYCVSVKEGDFSPIISSEGLVCFSLAFESFKSSVTIPAIVKGLASPCNY